MKITLENSLCTAGPSSPGRLTQMVRRPDSPEPTMFFIPPPPFYTDRHADLQLSLDNARYGRVTLLFKMQFRHDNDKILEAGCAMTSCSTTLMGGTFCKLELYTKEHTSIKKV